MKETITTLFALPARALKTSMADFSSSACEKCSETQYFSEIRNLINVDAGSALLIARCYAKLIRQIECSTKRWRRAIGSGFSAIRLK